MTRAEKITLAVETILRRHAQIWTTWENCPWINVEDSIPVRVSKEMQYWPDDSSGNDHCALHVVDQVAAWYDGYQCGERDARG